MAYYDVLWSTPIFYNIMQYPVAFCSYPWCTGMSHSILQLSVVYFDALWDITVFCGILQCLTVTTGLFKVWPLALSQTT